MPAAAEPSMTRPWLAKRASASPHRAHRRRRRRAATPPNRPGVIAPGSRFPASPSAIVSPTETRHDAAGGDRGGDGPGLARLDAGDVDPRARPCPEREPGEEAPAADRCDDGQLAGCLVVQFPADRGLAGDDERVVVGRDEGRLFGRPELEGVLLGDLVVVAVFDQLDREGPKGGDLGGRRVLGHDDGRRPGRGAPRPTPRRGRDCPRSLSPPDVPAQERPWQKGRPAP